jgi:hypothetical protein
VGGVQARLARASVAPTAVFSSSGARLVDRVPGTPTRGTRVVVTANRRRLADARLAETWMAPKEKEDHAVTRSRGSSALGWSHVQGRASHEGRHAQTIGTTT